MSRISLSLLSCASFFILALSSVHAGDEDDDDGVAAITAGVAKTKIKDPHLVTLARFSGDNPRVRYTQKLKATGKLLPMNRKSTKEHVQHAAAVSRDDNYKSHVLVQGMCMSSTLVWTKSLTALLEFPDVDPSNKKMDWTSGASTAASTTKYHRHKSTTGNYHSEPQLIADIEAVIKTDMDSVVKLFLPPAGNDDPIHMCGVELCGSFDMCDTCLNDVVQFRTTHQQGAGTLSRAIRDKLGDRFKGAREDAFVVIYHAQYPYKEVSTYNAEDDDYRYPLNYTYTFNGGRSDHFSPTAPDTVEDTYELSQHKGLLVEPGTVYGYIHCLADRTVAYSSPSKKFSF